MAFTIGVDGVGTLADLVAQVPTFYITSLLFVLIILGAVARLAGFSILRLIAYLKADLSSCSARCRRKARCRL